MTNAPIVIDMQAPIEDAVTKINEAGVRHLVVMEEGAVCGVISARDLLAANG